MRKFTVKIPRLPVAAPAADDAAPDPGPGLFGPLGWELYNETIFELSVGFDIYSPGFIRYVVATCPGAVAWRSEPEGLVIGITGAGLVYEPEVNCSVYAISATGAELGPIDITILYYQ